MNEFVELNIVLTWGDVIKKLCEKFDTEPTNQICHIAKSAVRYIMVGTRTHDPVYDIITGVAYADIDAKNLLSPIVNIFRNCSFYDELDDDFKKRIDYVEKLAEMRPAAQ